ncbi:DUF3304 domain-containing protein [Janthinobacterium sp. CG_23.3]|uniref:DUF3304 domain-containing protein n=1 Tax=Janthinobacterium sp. CG_23.3 TaxID=3349634 RepID=UPI0038D43691
MALLGCQDREFLLDTEPRIGNTVSLTITGYNYTNRYIDDFYVGSSGGGNLYVSSSNGGGGSSVCCASYVIGATLWKPIVRWQVGGCTYNHVVIHKSAQPVAERA